MIWELVALILSCGGVQFEDREDCEKLGEGPRRDECWATVAPDLFRQDSKEAEKIVEAQVGDSLVRDYIWLTVTREVDPSSRRYCDRINEPALAERCQVLVSRPHLHRALVGEEPASGPGGRKGEGPVHVPRGAKAKAP